MLLQSIDTIIDTIYILLLSIHLFVLNHTSKISHSHLILEELQLWITQVNQDYWKSGKPHTLDFAKLLQILCVVISSQYGIQWAKEYHLFSSFLSYTFTFFFSPSFPLALFLFSTFFFFFFSILQFTFPLSL